MRCLIYHQKPIWYANYTSVASVLDESNQDTGEKTITYTNPTKLMAHVSAARGMSDVEQFGDAVDYDKAVLVDDPDIAITEETVMWIDTAPSLDQQGATETPWDYVVRKIARSHQYAVIAVKKVVVA